VSDPKNKNLSSRNWQSMGLGVQKKEKKTHYLACCWVAIQAAFFSHHVPIILGSLCNPTAVSN